MSNIYQIPNEILETLDDDIKQKLQAYEPEDTSGLKTKANELLSEKKAADAARAEALAEVARLQAEMKKGKVNTPAEDSKLEDALAQLEAARQEADTLKKSMVDTRLDTEAKRISAELAPSDARRAALLAKEVRTRLQLEGDSFTVLNKDGKPTISSLDDLKMEVQKEYDFLIDGTKATGGGALGGNGRAVDTSKTIKHSEFKALSARERGELGKKGVTVIDD
jgi:hypothetical protein